MIRVASMQIHRIREGQHDIDGSAGGTEHPLGHQRGKHLASALC